jgi:purine-binding chemotaxis protein CheW
VDLTAIAGKYLTFRLANEEYGVEILKVQEIIQMQEVTRLPRTPAFVRGVINLRGKVVPVIDLRLKCGMDPADATDRTCIIVVQLESPNGGSLVLGTVVDEVSEVMDILPEEIEPAPAFGASIDTSFILGMAKRRESVRILLDIDRLLTDRELSTIANARGQIP